MTFAELIADADGADAAALTAILEQARSAIPEAEEGLSYGIAALLYRGRPVLGLGKNAKGYSLFPFSGAVVGAVSTQLPGFRLSKGAVGFSGAQPVPAAVVAQMIALRLAELEPSA